MHPPTLGPPPERVLALEHQLAPLAPVLGSDAVSVVGRRRHVAPNHLGQNTHPALLVRRRVGIKVDTLAIVEPDPEALLDKHVAVLLLGKCRPPPSSILARRLLFRQCLPVINEPLRVGKVNGSTRLPGGFVVGSELGAHELEVAATPVLIKPWLAQNHET